MLSESTAGRLMIAIGVLGVVASFTAVGVGIQLLTSLDSTLERSLTLTDDALSSLDGAVTLSERTVVLLDEGLVGVERTSGRLGGTMRQGSTLMESTAELTGTRLADSLQAVNNSMPALERVAAAIDGSLSTLALLPIGVDYDPEQPFDESIRDLQTSLDGVPEQLREQATLLELTGENLARAETDLDAVTEDLGAITDGLSQARDLLSGYATTAQDAQALVSEARDDLGRKMTLAKITVAVLGTTLALGQVVPLYIGFELLSGRRPGGAASAAASRGRAPRRGGASRGPDASTPTAPPPPR